MKAMKELTNTEVAEVLVKIIKKYWDAEVLKMAEADNTIPYDNELMETINLGEIIRKGENLIHVELTGGKVLCVRISEAGMVPLYMEHTK